MLIECIEAIGLIMGFLTATKIKLILQPKPFTYKIPEDGLGIPIASDVDFIKIGYGSIMNILMGTSCAVAWVVQGDNKIHLSHAKCVKDRFAGAVISGETIHLVIAKLSMEDCTRYEGIDFLGLHVFADLHSDTIDGCGLYGLDRLLPDY